jgi:hypothetical protein
MRRATITIPDDLDAELHVYMKEQDVAPSLTGLVEAALRKFLDEKRFESLQYQPPQRPFRPAPAEKGSGLHDVSLEHDRYFAEPE